ncbi:hypothetical protein GCM10027290_24350 [Micromonospora sonneratiae]|uniref:NurA domain-containing protein n=1 Tax=Micromonospora sonneratiae TaxID=1184706 RepID=A0ABW3YJL9_9ACTN
MTRWHVDGWNPAYGTSFEQGEAGGGPTAESSAQVRTDIEVKADQWQPLSAPAGLTPPPVVLLVDGVRRIDAGLWSRESDGTSYPGIAASYAAGVVRCDLARGAANLVARRVGRGLFTASQEAPDLVAGTVRYRVHRVNTSDVAKLSQTVQGPLTELEVEVSVEARRATVADDDLLIVDGPLRRRRNLPRTLGYVKTQQGKYLSAQLVSVVTSLKPGQRCPVFQVGTAWGGYSWYLRLPGPSGAPWAGIVRVECSTEVGEDEAIRLADLSLVTLPPFASTSYKDPRAPQNLIPIAGLERRLRSLLGDARLLHRALTVSAARA